MRMLAPLLALALLACSSSSSPSGNGASSLDRTKKISAATAADLPLVCDAWAAGVGGYGQAAKTQDCTGGVKNTVTPPSSQSACVAGLQGQDVSTCGATIGAFLDCQTATYANPCATNAEAPTCASLYTNPCWH